MPNRVDQFFRLVRSDVVKGPGVPYWQCRYCDQRFSTVDRTGRANVIGRNAHTLKHVREREAAKPSPAVDRMTPGERAAIVRAIAAVALDAAMKASDK